MSNTLKSVGGDGGGETRVLMVAGEASGDLHAGEVAKAMRREIPGAVLYGVGGDAMRRAGVTILHDASELAVVGLFEVVAKLFSIWRVFRTLVRGIAASRPALAILVDSPDFNLRVAKRLVRHGVPVLYFIGPQVWAWRPGRLNLMRRLVRKAAVVFPFEEQLYQRASVPVSFVGHPLLDQIAQPRDIAGERREARGRLGLADDGLWITLMPGSRRSEVRRILPPLIGAARRLARRGARFLLPVVAGFPRKLVESALARSALPIRLVPGGAHDCLRAADVAVVASGTATLEAALLGTPMVVVYRLNVLTYWIARAVVRVNHIAMANILAGREIVPELIQGAATATRIEESVARFLDDPAYTETTRGELLGLRSRLGEVGVAGRVAKMAQEIIARP